MMTTTTTTTTAATTTAAIKPTEGLTMYIIIFVPISLLLLAAIITALVFIHRRKRGRDLIRQSIYYGTSDVSQAVGHYGNVSTANEKDNYEPKPPLSPKDDPIYMNVQGESSLEPSVEGGRAENIYCNVGYDIK